MRPNGLGLHRISSRQVLRRITNRFQTYLLAGSLLILPPLPAAAQDQQPSRVTALKTDQKEVASEPQWSLDELRQLAITNNPTIGQAAASVDMSRGIQKQAGLYPNPQVGYLRSDSNPDGATRTSGAFFGQEIVTRKKLQKAQNAESWEVNQKNWNYEAQGCRRISRMSADLGCNSRASAKKGIAGAKLGWHRSSAHEDLCLSTHRHRRRLE